MGCDNASPAIDFITVLRTEPLRCGLPISKRFRILGFPTDLQAQFMLLACARRGALRSSRRTFSRTASCSHAELCAHGRRHHHRGSSCARPRGRASAGCACKSDRPSRREPLLCSLASSPRARRASAISTTSIEGMRTTSASCAGLAQTCPGSTSTRASRRPSRCSARRRALAPRNRNIPPAK